MSKALELKALPATLQQMVQYVQGLRREVEHVLPLQEPARGRPRLLEIARTVRALKTLLRQQNEQYPLPLPDDIPALAASVHSVCASYLVRLRAAVSRIGPVELLSVGRVLREIDRVRRLPSMPPHARTLARSLAHRRSS